MTQRVERFIRMLERDLLYLNIAVQKVRKGNANVYDFNYVYQLLIRSVVSNVSDIAMHRVTVT